jgi:hypothetical protein
VSREKSAASLSDAFYHAGLAVNDEAGTCSAGTGVHPMASGNWPHGGLTSTIDSGFPSSIPLEIPLHTNGSENDIRCQVTKRKISAGTRSDAGRDCRDAFLGLAKTCAKLRISFWDYLGSRLTIPGSTNVPYLPELVSQPP